MIIIVFLEIIGSLYWMRVSISWKREELQDISKTISTSLKLFYTEVENLSNLKIQII